MDEKETLRSKLYQFEIEKLEPKSYKQLCQLFNTYLDQEYGVVCVAGMRFNNSQVLAWNLEFYETQLYEWHMTYCVYHIEQRTPEIYERLVKIYPDFVDLVEKHKKIS